MPWESHEEHDPTRLATAAQERVPCYATTARPDLAKDMGFFGAKVEPGGVTVLNSIAMIHPGALHPRLLPRCRQVPLPWGPHAGNVGMRKNVEFIADWR